MTINICRPRALLMLFAAAVLAAGLLALVRADPAWAADRSFAPAQNYPVGSTPTTVTKADFNGDGKVDLAAQNAGSNSVSVLLGNGDGTFQPKQDFAVGFVPTSVISADFNSDSFADLAVANQNSRSVSVLLGQDLNEDGKGDGTFRTKQDFAVGSSPSSVISAHFNADSFADLAVANQSSNNVSVLLGQDLDGDGKGDGTFQAARNFPIDLPCGGFCIPATAGPNQVITADFNGDSKADLATANLGSCGFFCTPGGVSVLLGNGDGTFQGAKLAKSNATITSIDVSGSADIVATEYENNVVSVLRNNGNGTFSAGQRFQVGSNPSAVTSTDLDGDSVDDLAVSNLTSDNVSILWGNGGGSFQAAQNFLAGDGPIFVIGADLNADSFADLAVANQDSNNVSVLLNIVSPPETSITSGPSDGQVISSTSATFEFSSSEPGSTFQCALDDLNDSAYGPCTSPITVPDEGSLADGQHTFYVKATGVAGNNTDPTPATRRWTVDTAAPAAPVITSPPEGSLVSDSFAVSGTAEANSTVELFDGLDPRGTVRANTSGQWSINLTGISDGSHSYKAKATDAAGNSSAASEAHTVMVDATVPTVTGKSPKPNSTGISPRANVSVTFSEAMMQSSLDRTTVKLVKKGTTRAVRGSFSYPAPNKVVLNPTDSLVRGATYRITLVGGTSGAKDLVGNALAADVSWSFKVRA